MTWRNANTRCRSISAAGPSLCNDDCLSPLRTWGYPSRRARYSLSCNASGETRSPSTSVSEKPQGCCAATPALQWLPSTSCRRLDSLPLSVSRTSTHSRAKAARRARGDCAGSPTATNRHRTNGKKSSRPVHSVQRKCDLRCTQCNANMRAAGLRCTQCNAKGPFPELCGVPSAPYQLLPLPTTTTGRLRCGLRMRAPLFSRRKTGND